ncbi:MAG: nucleotidyltransferase domain-containing protein [Gemmatimonadota bacterium]
MTRFREELLPCLERVFEPERVIVFGSRARGEALTHSDLDVILVSEAFTEIPWLERPLAVHDACDIRFGVELLCYTPEEFDRKRDELGVVRTAVEEGFDPREE